MAKTQMIGNRVRPCRCGCGGSDSWHARYFSRVVRNVAQLPYVVDAPDLSDGSTDEKMDAFGTARFPWGVGTVVRIVVWGETSQRWVSLGWYRTEDV